MTDKELDQWVEELEDNEPDIEIPSEHETDTQQENPLQEEPEDAGTGDRPIDGGQDAGSR